MSNEEKSFPKTSINWYPGHMAKTKRLIKENIKSIDIVINIVDARIPYSSSIIDLETFTPNKQKIIVMSKYDLCDKDETSKWIQYYKSKGYSVVTCDLKRTNDHKKVINEVDKVMKNINSKRKEKDLLAKKANVLVVGVPNVGKSTLINRLVNKSVNETGNKPGVTKNFNTIKINEKMNLIDTPGILWSKIESEEVALNLASMTIIKENVLNLGAVAIHILKKLNESYKDLLKKHYNLDEFNEDEYEEVYSVITKFRSIPLYKGEIDYDRINELIVNDIKSERLKEITFDKIN